MVTGENTQIVSLEVVSGADEEKVLCIIRDLVDTQSTGRKQTINLPASTPLGSAAKEIAKICGYVQGSVSVHYEQQDGDTLNDMVLEDHADAPLASICSPEVRRHNFAIHEVEGKTPQREEETSGYESQVSSSSFSYESKNYDTYPATSTSCDYSYSSALIKSDTGYVGLVNQAMTCYLNSLLQTLFMTPEFRNALYRWEYKKKRDDDAAKSIPFQLQRLFLQLQTSGKRSVETTDLTKSFGWDSSEVWQQHDVQELCRVMFDALEHTWKNTAQAKLINHLYQGQLKDYVKCLECECESARRDSYLDIPLVVRPFGSNQAYCSVEDSMDAFVQPEILEGANQYFCEKCNKKCNAHKGLKFLTFPYLLTLQLKRFDFDYTTLHRIKLNDRMTFPEILDLNRFIEVVENGELGEAAEKVAVESDSTTTGAKVCATPVSADKNDDEGIDEGIEVEAGCSAASSSSDASSVSSEAATNDRNARETASKGPYVYELFSIMIHSGSAAGGHYYAYIKSFTDGQWYSFNDQQVTKITYDDIQKTYGGATMSRTYYSSAYSSSTSAYMLMYRQIDKQRNADFMAPEDFPEVLKRQLQEQQNKEEQERKQRELDKSTCKIKVYMFHPEDQRKMEARLEIHKDKTLAEATVAVHKLFELEGFVDVSCCRLVKYDEYLDSLERSYEGEEDTCIATLLGGVKATYNFDLLLERRRPDQVFQPYKPGGVTVKVFVVDIQTETIHPPVSVRAYLVQTVDEFKTLLSKVLSLPRSSMRLVLERFHNDLRLLITPAKTLKAEGFFKSNKVYVECSGDETDTRLPYVQTRLYRLLDRHQNTIRIHVDIPTQETVSHYLTTLQQSRQRLHYYTMRGLGGGSGAGGDTSNIAYLREQRRSSLGGVAGGDYSGQMEEGGGVRGGDLDARLASLGIGMGGLNLHTSHSDPSIYHSCRAAAALDEGVSVSVDCDPGVDSDNDNNSNSSLHCSPSGSDGRSASPIVHSSSSPDTSTSAEFSLSANFPSPHDAPLSSPEDPDCDPPFRRTRRHGEVNQGLQLSSPDHCDMQFGEGDKHMDIGDCDEHTPLIDSDSHMQRRENWDNELMPVAQPPPPPPLPPSKLPNPVTQSSGQGGGEGGGFESSSGVGQSGWEADEEDSHRYFYAAACMVSDPGVRSLTVFVDKRITLGAFKKELESHIGTTSDNFKVYRVYSNNQEFESVRLSDTLSFLEDGKLNVKMGRALRPGEHRVKVYQLNVNDTEPCKFLTETIFAKGMTVLESKHLIVAEMKDKCGVDIPIERCRLRKKSWKNPGTVYINGQVYEDEIAIFPNWEIFLEVLDKPDELTSMQQLAIYLRRWRPSTFTLDPFQEVVLSVQSVDELKQKISVVSGIPLENVEFAKGKGTFPCETSVLEMHTDLDWNPQVTTLNVWPLYICDDGHVIFYRDKTEELAELSEDKKKEIQQKENIRISRHNQRLSYSPRKERALKIYTEDHPTSPQSKNSPDLD